MRTDDRCRLFMTAGKHRLREQAIAALLTEPTLDRAAHQAGVGEKTLRRWMHDDFRAAYAAARDGVGPEEADEEPHREQDQAGQ